MPSHAPTRTLHAAALAACLLCGGCYDPVAMIERVRNDAIQSRLEEVELGEFHVTLPRDKVNNETLEVFVEVYGTAVRYRIGQIREHLEANSHTYQQQVLMAIRNTSSEDLSDPDLTKLREDLFKVTNQTLGDTPVDRVGIAYIRLVRH